MTRLKLSAVLLAAIAYVAGFPIGAAGAIALLILLAVSAGPVSCLAALSAAFLWSAFIFSTWLLARTSISNTTTILLLTPAMIVSVVFVGRIVLVAPESFLNRVQGLARPWMREALAAAGGLCFAAALISVKVPLADTLMIGTTCFALRSRISGKDPSGGFAWRWVAAGSLLLVVSLSMSLAILEIGARMWIKPGPNTAPSLFEADPQYLFRLRPGASLWHWVATGPDETTLVRDEISGQRLRGGIVPPKETGEYRILLLGDSFTFGSVTTFEDTIGSQLQRMFDERYSRGKVRVVNLGVPGTGPWQQRGWLNEIGFDLNPDAVVHQLFLSNDVGNTLTATDERLDACIPEQEYMISMWRMHRFRRVRFEHWLHVHSRAYAAFGQVVGRKAIVGFLLKGTRLLPELSPPAVPSSAARPFALEVDLDEWYPKLERGWKQMMDDIGETSADCIRRDLRYVAYNIPYHEEISDAGWSAPSDPGRYGVRYERGKAERRTREDLERRGIDSFSVFEVLHAGGDAEELYYIYDGHLTPKGNRLVAERIFEYVVKARWLPDAKNVRDEARAQESRTAVP